MAKFKIFSIEEKSPTNVREPRLLAEMIDVAVAIDNRTITFMSTNNGTVVAIFPAEKVYVIEDQSLL